MSFIASVKNIFSSVLKNEGDRRKFLKVIAPSFIIHFIAGLLTLLTVLLLTRKLGARQYGLFTYSFGIITLLAKLSMSGINIMAVREPAALMSTGRKGLWRGFYLWSSRFVLIVSIAIALLAGIFIICAKQFHILKYSAYVIPILFAIAAIPFYCLMNYYSSLLRGQHKTVLSFLPDNIIKPVFFLIFLFCFFHFNVVTAIWARNLSYTVGFIFTIIAFYRTAKMDSVIPEYNTAAWKASLKSFFLLIALTSISSKLDMLLLGYYKNASQVGIYYVADIVAAKIGVFQGIMNQIYVAPISRLHALNEKEKLQRLVTKVTRWVTVLSLPLFLVATICSKWILSYFGPAFTDGQTALIIICIGQFVSILFGSVGNLSVTTKNEKVNVTFIIVKMAVITLINIILTPIIGLNGTAIATSAGIIVWNVGMFIIVKKKTGISTWIFG